jgi:hypothetical protein
MKKEKYLRKRGRVRENRREIEREQSLPEAFWLSVSKQLDFLIRGGRQDPSWCFSFN